MPDDLWLWLGRSSALLGAAVSGLALLPALLQPAYFRRHFFFLFYLAVVCMYLQVAPVLSQMAETPAVVFVYRMPRVQDLRPQYGWLQVEALLAFQVPLMLAYFGLRRGRPHGELAAHPVRATLLAISMSMFALAFVGVLVRGQMWNVRLGDALTERLMQLSPLDFAVFRLYQECGLFVVGLMLFAWRYSSGTARRWCFWAFILVTAVFGGFNLLNSRWFVTSLLVCIVGWLVMSSPVPSVRRHLVRLAMVAVIGLVAVYLSIVVVNIRNASDGVTVATLSPLSGGVFADTQGINRLDCIDLMARLKGPLERQGPAYLQSWGQVTWLVWRFVDPQGFDAYRLSRQTTAKSYLMREYLGIVTSDYFSCTVTDLYGNFRLAGLLVGGLVIGAMFAWTTGTLSAPSSGTALVIAVFVLTQIVIFDQEAVFTLFGWIRRLPVLLVALSLRPFTVRAGS
jgi:hypothetical protein